MHRQTAVNGQVQIHNALLELVHGANGNYAYDAIEKKWSPSKQIYPTDVPHHLGNLCEF